MDLDTLRLFVASCEVGNLAQVAARENLSPSALTKRIQKLEHQLGTQLIKRVHRGIEPTPAGHLLMEKSAVLLGNVQDIRDMLHMHGEPAAGVVTVIGSYSMTAGKLTEDIGNFLSLHENKKVTINLKESDKQGIVDALRSGRASLGVLWNAVETSGLQTFNYHSDHASIIVSHKHPLAKHDSITYDQIFDFETVRTKTTRRTELMLQRLGHILELNRRNRIEVPSFEALLRLVHQCGFVGLCPQGVAEQYQATFKFKIIPLTDSWAKRTHVIACLNEATLHPAAQLLLNHLKAQALHSTTEIKSRDAVTSC